MDDKTFVKLVILVCLTSITVTALICAYNAVVQKWAFENGYEKTSVFGTSEREYHKVK